MKFYCPRCGNYFKDEAVETICPGLEILIQCSHCGEKFMLRIEYAQVNWR